MIFSQKNISKFFVKVFFPRVLISLIITIGFTTLQSPAWAADGDLDTSFSNKSIDKLISKALQLNNFAIIGPRIRNFKYKNKHFIKKKLFKNTNQMNFIDLSC